MPRYTVGCVLDPDRPTVGRMFPQPEVVSRDAVTVRLDDVLGPWFALLTWSSELGVHLDERAAAVWRRLGATFVVVRPMTQLHWIGPDEDGACVVGDRDGSIKQWFDAADGSVVLLRPDRFVAAVVRPPDVVEMTRASPPCSAAPHCLEADPRTRSGCSLMAFRARRRGRRGEAPGHCGRPKPQWYGATPRTHRGGPEGHRSRRSRAAAASRRRGLQPPTYQ